LYSVFESQLCSVTTFPAIVPCETEKEKRIFLFSKQGNSNLTIFTDTYLNYGVKTSLEVPKHTCHLSEESQTGKDWLVDKFTSLRRTVTCVPWTGNPSWPGFVEVWLYSSVCVFASIRLKTRSCLSPRSKYLEECESEMNKEMNKRCSSKRFPFLILDNSQISTYTI